MEGFSSRSDQSGLFQRQLFFQSPSIHIINRFGKKMKQIFPLVFLFSNSFAFQAIDTGLGRKDPVRNQHLIKDFGSLMLLLGNNNNTSTLPSNFTICSSISTADAKVPAAFFQLLGETNEAWISVSVLFGDKTKKIHVIKVMVSWLLSSNHT